MTLDVREINDWPAHVDLRPPDLAECLLGGMTGEFALQRSIELSLSSFVATHDGEPLAFWGYAPQSLAGQVCYAWMLSTVLADRFPILLGLGSRRIVSNLLTLYPHIIINVDPAHLVAIAWLDWLGFTVDGMDGQFVQMRKSRWAH